MTYKGIDVREINTVRNTSKKMNGDTEEGKEFNKHMRRILAENRELVQYISKKTGIDSEKVSGIIDDDDDDVVYNTPNLKQVIEMIREKSKHYKPPPPGARLRSTRRP